MRDFLVTLVGVLIGLTICVCGIAFGYSQWHHEIYAAKHPPGWVKRTAVVESVSGTRYNVTDYQNQTADPPVVSARLQYQDYRNFSHTVAINMTPETVAMGDHVTMYVRKDESVYVPVAADWNNLVTSWSDVPMNGKALPVTWPMMGFIIGIFGGIFGGVAAAWLACLVSKSLPSLSLRGRLGTR